MKAEQVNKLYSKLTPHELAVLAFEALSRLDTNEIEIIAGSIPRETYRCVHNLKSGFSSHFSKIFEFSPL